jgi:hypothetical protein
MKIGLLMFMFLASVAVRALCAGCATTSHEGDNLHARSIAVHVPTTLEVDRTYDQLSISVNHRTSLALATIAIAPGMAAGVAEDFYVYRAGQPRPSVPWTYAIPGSLDFDLKTRILERKLDDLPLVGELYVVEVDLVIFETEPKNFDSVPSVSQMKGDKKFNILWRQHFKQVIK